ncbi:hypothetical protein QA645_40625 [Bradyrhizobium sp. CIAT3101]|uniref:hypothetical protein n=1 Tax=Bradyrhizobium sp. CIAT3101 TaxID=439387 RepID=UPI0024B0E692|nr:hypothetical protein [Bradyrhizobium sp. CIAT3101]WFU80665.1 hypothetical protein QA645_40625 [Bradyrhizobium sp. CIAT3101]
MTMVAASAILLRLIQQSPRKKAEHASAETAKPSDRLSAHNARRVGCCGDTIREVLGFGDTAASSHSLEDDVDVCHCSKPVRPTFHQIDDPCPVALKKVLTRLALNDSGSDPLAVVGFDQIVIQSFAIDR